MTEGESGRAEAARPAGWSSEVRATVISVVVTALLNPIVARLDVVPLWGIVLGDVVIALVLVVILVHPMRNAVRRAARSAWSLRPTFHLRVEQKQRQMLETNRDVLEAQRKVYEARIAALEHQLDPGVPRDYPEYVQEMIDLAHERNEAQSRASKADKDLRAEREQTKALQASLTKAERDLAEFAKKAKDAGDRATRAEQKAHGPVESKQHGDVTSGPVWVPAPRWRIYSSPDEHDLFIVENLVPKSIATWVRIECDSAYAEIADAATWEDFSGNRVQNFRAIQTGRGLRDGVSFELIWTDGEGDVNRQWFNLPPEPSVFAFDGGTEF